MKIRTEVRAEAGDNGNRKESNTRSDDTHRGLFLGHRLSRRVDFIGYTA